MEDDMEDDGVLTQNCYKYRASAKGALAKGPFLLRGPIHRTRFSTGPIHCTCIFNLKKKIFFLFKFLLKIKKIFFKNF